MGEVGTSSHERAYCVSHRCHSLKTLPILSVVCEEWRGKQQAFSCGGNDCEIGAGEGWKPNTRTEMSRSQRTQRDAPLSWLNLAPPYPSCLFFSLFFGFVFFFPLLHKMFIFWHSKWGLPGLVIHSLKAQSCSGAPWDHSTAEGAWHLQTSGSDLQHQLPQLKFWESSPPNCSFPSLAAPLDRCTNSSLLAFTKPNLRPINRSGRVAVTSEWQPWFQPSCKHLQVAFQRRLAGLTAPQRGAQWYGHFSHRKDQAPSCTPPCYLLPMQKGKSALPSYYQAYLAVERYHQKPPSASTAPNSGYCR